MTDAPVIPQDHTLQNDYVVVQLDESNKQKLIQRTIQALATRDAESQAILVRLSQLNPELAGDLALKDLALAKTPLRLIFTKDSPILEDPSHHAPSYVVVSYCWHNDSWTPGNRSRTGLWPFCKEMVQSILDLRESTDEGIFVDQPCIDQDNEEEKGLAVAAMNIIYGAARRMVILLEDVTFSEEEEAVAAKFRDLILQQQLGDQVPSDEEKETLSRVFLRLTSARWFSRAWCIHEIKVTTNWQNEEWANQHTFRVYCSDGKILRLPLIFVVWCMPQVLDIIKNRPIAPIDDVEKQNQLYWRFMSLMAYSPVQELHKVSTELSLMTQYARMSPFGCLIRSDKIGVALNVCGLGIRYNGDAQTEDYCFWVFTMLSLSAGEVGILALGGQPLQLLSEGSLCISWARRTHDSWVANELRLPIRSSKVDIGRSTPRWVELDLLLFTCEVTYASKPNLELAWSFVKDLESKQIQSMHSRWDFSEKTSPGSQQDKHKLEKSTIEPSLVARGHRQTQGHYIQCIIAIMLDLGLSWVKRILPLIETALRIDTVIGNNLTTVNEDLRPLTNTLMPHLIKQPKGSTNLAWNQGDFDKTHRLLSIFANQHFHGAVPWPAMIQTHSHPTHFALTKPLPLAHKHVIAMPVTLTDESYSLLNRAWVLERVDSTGYWPVRDPASRPPQPYLMSNPPTTHIALSEFMRPLFTQPSGGSQQTIKLEDQFAWRIADKTPIVGCPKLVPDGKTLKLLKKQRVYGRNYYHANWADKEQVD